MAVPEEKRNYSQTTGSHHSEQLDINRGQSSGNQMNDLSEDMELDSPERSPSGGGASRQTELTPSKQSNQYHDQPANQSYHQYNNQREHYDTSYYHYNQYNQGQYYNQQSSHKPNESQQHGQTEYNTQYDQQQGQYQQQRQQQSQVQYEKSQEGQGQYDQSQGGQGQYDQSQESQGQYDQSQEGQGQYDQSQEGQGQYNQSQEGQGPYDQSQESQYDQTYQQQQRQNESYQQQYYQQSQYYQQQYDQQQQGQYEQSYQQQKEQYQQYTDHQQQQGQYQGQYDQQQGQYSGQNTYSSNYYAYHYPYNYMWTPWQHLPPPSAYTTTTPPTTTNVRGGEWPQWTGTVTNTHTTNTHTTTTPTTIIGAPTTIIGAPTSTARGRGVKRGLSPRGRGRGKVRQSRWETSDKDTYNAVPPPNQQFKKTTPIPPSVTTATPALVTPTSQSSTTSKTDEANTPISEWPPGLQEYMVKAFESCKADSEKTQVEQYLKVEINNMFRDKRVWQVDWFKEPLPLDKLKRQAQKRKSRWDTPSPSQVPPLSPPTTMPQATTNQGEGTTFNKKKRKAKRGRGGKFFIDRTGAAVPPAMTEEDKLKVGQRAQRFAKGQAGNRKFKQKLSINDLLKNVSVSGEDNDWDSLCIEGTSRELEKRYLRLTSAPDPSTVRPEHILRKSLSLVLSKEKDYRYVCEQLKSIRQDLTIQGIRNSFTIEVYERHGRIALQNGDWGEFNQCQSQLSALYYSEGLPGCKAEFLAYRIFYYMMTNDSSEFFGVFREMSLEISKDPCVIHAIKMREAWSSGNYRRFFRLYPITPNFGRNLIDLFIDRERKSALKTIAKAYRPSISIEYISCILNFSSQEECREFLVSKCEAVLDSTGTNVDCRLTYDNLK